MKAPKTVFALALLVAGPWALGAACDSNTGGRPVEVSLAFSAPSDDGLEAGQSFENIHGWSVTLNEAYIAVGAAYFNENPDLLAALPSLLPVAHAHPGHGHFAGGTVRAEWLGQRVHDALSPRPTLVREVPGIAGTVASWTLLVEPPRTGTDPSDQLRGYRAYMVGRAERDGVVVDFEGGLETLGEQQSDTGGTRFEGLPIDASLDDATTITVDVDVRAWLDEAQFGRLLDDEGACTQSTDDDRCFITPGSQVHQAWALGLLNRRAFTAHTQQQP